MPFYVNYASFHIFHIQDATFNLATKDLATHVLKLHEEITSHLFEVKKINKINAYEYRKD